jgi:bifunctional aspartokinase / homoserine dehydrogenase 1
VTPRLHGRAQRLTLRRGTAPELRGDAHVLQPRAASNPMRRETKKPLEVMKFGGTSVANAACIRNVVKIIRKASAANNIVVVVSAMSGVTNKLVEAAARSEAGDSASAAAILDGLRRQHFATVDELIPPGARHEILAGKVGELFDYCDRLCQGTALLRELTLRARDAIWSLGERLSAPILAAALVESGVASEAVEATDVIVTDSRHGAADPLMDMTRERCETRLWPLIEQDIVPVTTGFIGATPEGVLTILGRGGSDYSATIVGAALDADEVIIWTDVDGVLTADPNHVRGTRTIPEMSYREAAEHAHFGAKVLHPKTLRALMQCKFPLWVRNTFTPERPGTKITPEGSAKNEGVKAITAISEVSMITVGGPGIAVVPDVLGRTFAVTAAIRAEVLLTSHSSSQNDVCLIVSSAQADRTAESLRYEFGQDLSQAKGDLVQVDANVAIVTVIGQNMRALSGIVGRTFSALGRNKVNILATAQGSSECNISFVVARKDVKTALVTAHREFRLGRSKTSRDSRTKS